MVLKNTESTIAYRCPHCGSGILSLVGVFSLSGDMIKLKCDCGKSELLIQKCGDGKLRLTVPCMFCPKPHQFVFSHAAFFDESIYTIPCAMTGIDICFIGHKDDVLKSLDDAEKQILELLKQAGYGADASLEDLLQDNAPDGDDDEYDGDVNFTDNHIYDMVLFVIKELMADDRIFCRCTDRGETGEYDVVCDRDSIYVTCNRCGARHAIRCNGSMATQAFLETDSLTLGGMRADFSDDEDESDGFTESDGFHEVNPDNE
ncbi:MAG: hypothetical protein IJ449_13425 [Clostridia bacterium]|nr:hypothetical protein [Clostridia bacterium]